MTINFQSLHAPRGAHAHFDLGLFGGGGFAHESNRAASNDVFIGWKRGNQIACFPFFRNVQSAELATFVGEHSKPSQLTISAFTESQNRTPLPLRHRFMERPAHLLLNRNPCQWN